MQWRPFLAGARLVCLRHMKLDALVGADLSRTPPIDRPGERIDGPLADQSALRQYIVRLRGITDGA